MFAALAKFRVIDRNIQVRRALARPMDLVQANDNRPATLREQTPRFPRRAVLVGRWQPNADSGRLEWHWAVEGAERTPTDEPQPSIGDGRGQAALDGATPGGHRAPARPRRVAGI